MKSHMRRSLLLCAFLALPGCGLALGTVAVTGAISYGEMKVDQSYGYTDFRASVKDTRKAVLDQLKELKVKPEVEEDTDNMVKLKLKKATITIEVHPTDTSYTRVTADLGLFDQNEKQRTLRKFFNQVGDRLGQESRVPEYPGSEQTGNRDKGASGPATDDRAYEK